MAKSSAELVTKTADHFCRPEQDQITRSLTGGGVALISRPQHTSELEFPGCLLIPRVPMDGPYEGTPCCAVSVCGAPAPAAIASCRLVFGAAGGLIQAAVGTGEAVGGPVTNLSGWDW